MSYRLIIATVFLAASTTACRPSVRESFTAYALPRASFETKCPKEKIVLSPLTGTLEDYAIDGATVGVDACGQSAVYVYSDRLGWVLNSTTTGGEGR